MRSMRYLFAVLAVLFVAGIIYQVFLAGSAVFGAGTWTDHVDFGYVVASVPLLLIVAALLARAGRPTTWLCVGTLVMATVQTFLPLLKEDVPWIAALHPVNAMVVFGLGVVIARRAVALARLPVSSGVTQAEALPQEL